MLLSVRGAERNIEQFVQHAKQLEDLGWDGLWIGEVGLDPFSLLSVIATRTSTINLGTSIATWARSVPTMAACAATVDLISKGRFRLGLGTMPKAWNEDWHGIDTTRIVRRMREYIEAIRAAWTAHSGRTASYEGELLHLRKFTGIAPPFRERVPVYLGASGPQMVSLAGQLTEGILIHPLQTVRTISEVVQPQLRRAAEKVGRDPSEIDQSITIWCSISDDRREALHWLKAQIAYYIPMPYVHWVFDYHGWTKQKEEAWAAYQRGDQDGIVDAITDDIAEAVGAAGTPDEVREKVAALEQLSGLPRLNTVTRCPPDFSAANTARIVELFSPR
jgi:probable F420-dependent oxidoreductase